MDSIQHYDSPLGRITLAADGASLIGLWFEGQKHFAAALAAEREERPLPVLDQARMWLDIYFSGRAPDFTPPLNLRATAFRRAVWRILLTIPFGQTMSYGEIAARMAKERALSGVSGGASGVSARAVGGAVGRNPIALIIPCHRVVGADGALTGYAGGLDRKARLLELEGAAPVALLRQARKRLAGKSEPKVL